MSRSPPPKTRARQKKRPRVKRALAIALVATGVLLEVLANVVQLAESDIVHRAVYGAMNTSLPATVHRAVRDALQ